jgi:hypothetical protein
VKLSHDLKMRDKKYIYSPKKAKFVTKSQKCDEFRGSGPYI